MIKPAILKKLESLPESLQMEVLHYIEFLSERYAKTESEAATSKKKRGGLGILQGKIRMANDFDAPLKDLKEYM